VDGEVGAHSTLTMTMPSQSYGVPQRTYGRRLMAVPASNGPVTMATVCQVDESSGKESRRATFLSPRRPGADTWAPPARSTLPVGQDSFATSTVPTSGFLWETSVAEDTTSLVVMLPAGPTGPCVPGTPWTPWTPCGPCGPCGPDELDGIVARATAASPTPTNPRTTATTTPTRTKRRPWSRVGDGVLDQSSTRSTMSMPPTPRASCSSWIPRVAEDHRTHSRP